MNVLFFACCVIGLKVRTKTIRRQNKSKIIQSKERNKKKYYVTFFPRRFRYRSIMLGFHKSGFLLIGSLGFFFFATTRQSKELFSLHGFAIYLWSKSASVNKLILQLQTFYDQLHEKLIERKTNDPFILLEKYFFAVVMLCKKQIMMCNLKTSYTRY
jgi:Na+/melibiose symporter-like transporter